MSVKTDANGRRWISVEVEVPGTPEQVWEAIATGPGVSSWFVPTRFHTREDGVGVVTSSFGPGMESVAIGTVWDPPRHFAKESPGMTPGSPPLATEWFVEVLSGSTCRPEVGEEIGGGDERRHAEPANGGHRGILLQRWGRDLPRFCRKVTRACGLRPSTGRTTLRIVSVTCIEGLGLTWNVSLEAR
ncbi:MAG TPA: hypothetical protein VFE33_30875 [Thermoanaerobaculia bacterium]|nr:hypothetical protein [Thermoanaerobaculia bacterium]